MIQTYFCPNNNPIVNCVMDIHSVDCIVELIQKSPDWPQITEEQNNLYHNLIAVQKDLHDIIRDNPERNEAQVQANLEQPDVEWEEEMMMEDEEPDW